MMKKNLIALSCAAVLLSVLAAPTDASSHKLAVTGETFAENFSSAPLSSEGLLGVVAVGKKISPDPSQLTVWLPEHSSLKLWIDIESADGLYSARAEYDIGEIRSTKYVLEFPTQYGSQLKNYRSDELAVLATLHGAPKSDSEFSDPVGQGIVAAAWDSSATLDSLVILFSSGGASFMELAVLTEQSDTVITCYQADPQLQRQRTAYDAHCRVAVSSSLLLETAILARQDQDGMSLRQIRIPILLP
ncbi:MAG: hypothetical protein GY839_05705 [candidate division Zixibacteria bacterium]|nr:hypothetical protein [candidate division Zixibacteria bacterium]